MPTPAPPRLQAAPGAASGPRRSKILNDERHTQPSSYQQTVVATHRLSKTVSSVSALFSRKFISAPTPPALPYPLTVTSTESRKGGKRGRTLGRGGTLGKRDGGRTGAEAGLGGIGASRGGSGVNGGE